MYFCYFKTDIYDYGVLQAIAENCDQLQSFWWDSWWEMPRKAAELKPLAVSKLAKPGLHAVGSVAGLNLSIQPSGSKSWILRVTIGGKRREIGLGGYPDVSLSDARALARDYRMKINSGVDPVRERDLARRSVMRSQNALTFEQAAERFFEEKQRKEFSSSRHATIWINSLRNHIFPKIGSRPIIDLRTEDILLILRPLWEEQPQTGKKVRQRIAKVFEWSIASQHSDTPNPARWEGNLSLQLPAPSKVKEKVPHPAVQVEELPRWYSTVEEVDGFGALALRFLAMTAVRSANVRQARWSDIDLKAKLWTVPKENMKMRKPHRVPIGPTCEAFLAAIPKIHGCDLLFPGRGNVPMSDATIAKAMKQVHDIATKGRGYAFLDGESKLPAVPHGLRSSFSVWVSERTTYPANYAEFALAHEVGNEVERAYQRSDIVEKRRQMMEDWALFLHE